MRHIDVSSCRGNGATTMVSGRLLVQLKIEGSKEHKGFLLGAPVILSGSVIVLTGKNGSGKTRLIESLQNQCSRVSIDGEYANPQDVILVAQNSLNPSFGSSYSDAEHEKKVTASLQLYDRIKKDLNESYRPNKAELSNRSMNRVGGLDYESLFKLFNGISTTLKKPASELTHDDIKLNYKEPIKNVLGIQNTSTIFNQYVKRRHTNKYNRWRCEENGEDVNYWSEDDFVKKFGERPWIITNRILEDMFDGKFQFSMPDEKSQSYAYQAQLMQDGIDLPISVENLSSGERTLFWLALTLFNTQYCDAEITNVPKLLLIDEPDAFLHPQMVLKMYKALDVFNQYFKSILIISTHSPTTVALAPSDSVYLVENNSVSEVEKDSAIAELLDGVSQISLNSKNRRQVFVESQYDADVYHAIYSKIAHSSNAIDPRISLSFVSSGPKIPKQQLIDKVNQIFGISENKIVDEFVVAINGVGSCAQVRGQVGALVESENNSVRGIVDWDLKNQPANYVSVLAENYAYSIENVVLDPICILMLLHTGNAENNTMLEICGESNIDWEDWIKNESHLQKSVDKYILKILEKDNEKNSELNYVSGMKLFTDVEYLHMNGHDLEARVKKVYPELKSFCRKGKSGELKSAVVNKSMIVLARAGFIPIAFEKVLSEVQR